MIAGRGRLCAEVDPSVLFVCMAGHPAFEATVFHLLDCQPDDDAPYGIGLLDGHGGLLPLGTEPCWLPVCVEVSKQRNVTFRNSAGEQFSPVLLG